MATKKQIALTGVLSIAALTAAYFISPFEGEKFKAYRDGGGVWTICRGHTLDVHKGDVATKAQCAAFYKEDISDAQQLFDLFVKRETPNNPKAAAISFIFNTGPQNFASSTLRKKLQAGDVVGACNEFPRWHNVAGKDCRIQVNDCYGIVIRREMEKELCLDKTNYYSYSLDAYNIFHGVRTTQLASKSP